MTNINLFNLTMTDGLTEVEAVKCNPSSMVYMQICQ